MRKLRLMTRLLCAVLLALGARALFDGLTLTVAGTAAVMAVLLVACLYLLRQGRQLETQIQAAQDRPASRHKATRPRDERPARSGNAKPI